MSQDSSLPRHTQHEGRGQHQPVLLAQVLTLLNPQLGETYLDLTAGYGGHAEAISQRLGEDGRMILVDQDADAIEQLRQRFGRHGLILHMDFESAVQELRSRQEEVHIALLDLGMSSPQLENPHRGFSFSGEGPLDMRMDTRQKLTAADIVNRYNQRDLADILYHYGEERRSRRIAKHIVQSRPITTTTELAQTVARAIGGRRPVPSGTRRRRIHPATRTFQALRIAVNDELGRLERTLPALLELLAPGGRLAVISFHSLEDRIVKRFIQEHSRGTQPVLENLTKQVIQGRFEDANNPRARSGKLRAAMKRKNPTHPSDDGSTG